MKGVTWLPDGYSQIFGLYVFGPLGFWTMAPLCYAAKFDPLVSLDCARVEGMGIKFCHLATLGSQGSLLARRPKDIVVLGRRRSRR